MNKQSAFRIPPVAMVIVSAAASVCVAASATHPSGVVPHFSRTLNGVTSSNGSAGRAPAAVWRPLFDGKTMNGWRGFRKQGPPTGWAVVDGALARVSTAEDIVTTEQFDDFELSLQWRISPGGNSGIFYRVSEEAEGVYETGPEMQVLDNSRHVDGKKPETSAGALYGLYPAVKDVTRPVGEWNDARIIVRGNHVEHWLNNEKLVECEIGSPDWTARVSASKFKQWPKFGTVRKGHIALQDHGDPVWYRDIKIR